MKIIFLTSDAHQFHQLQQNKQSSLTFTRRTQKNTTTYDVGNLGPSLGQVKLEAQSTEPVSLT